MNLEVDCYVYTRDIDARLDNISCLDSLRVCFLDTSCTDHEGGWADKGLGSNPFQDRVNIISRNTRLKHLHLSLQKGYKFSISSLYSEIEDYTLQVLGPTIADLDSLVLEGDLHFTDKH